MSLKEKSTIGNVADLSGFPLMWRYVFATDNPNTVPLQIGSSPRCGKATQR